MLALSETELKRRLTEARRALAAVQARQREGELAAMLPELEAEAQRRAGIEAEHKAAMLRAASERLAAVQVAVNRWRDELYDLVLEAPTAEPPPLEVQKIGFTMDYADRQTLADFQNRLGAHCRQLPAILEPARGLLGRGIEGIDYALDDVLLGSWARYVHSGVGLSLA